MALHEPRSDRARAGDAKLEINPKRSLLASSGREHSFLPELPVLLRLHGLSVLDHTYLSLISYTFPAPFLGTVSLIAVFFFLSTSLPLIPVHILAIPELPNWEVSSSRRGYFVSF